MDKIKDFIAYKTYWHPHFRAIAIAIEKASIKQVKRKIRNVENFVKGGFNGCGKNAQ